MFRRRFSRRSMVRRRRFSFKPRVKVVYKTRYYKDTRALSRMRSKYRACAKKLAALEEIIDLTDESPSKMPAQMQEKTDAQLDAETEIQVEKRPRMGPPMYEMPAGPYMEDGEI